MALPVVKLMEDPPPRGPAIRIYRDEDGSVNECSAVCTHMKCIVNWNNAEKTWDCPCHGSRFDTFGKVIEGPALTGLEPADE